VSAPALSALPGWEFARSLSERRTLILQLVKRDFSQRFVGSAAGWLWTLLHPLVLLLSWVFVFQWCLRIPPPAGAGDSYTLYLFCGYLPWMLFQETVQRSSNSLVEQTNLITKTVFPSEIIPVSLFLSALLSHGLALAIAVVVVAAMTTHASVLIVLLPIYTALLGLFTIGVAWIVSSLQVYLRDTAQVVIVMLTGWFWITPIFVEAGQFPEGARFLVHYNPLAYVVQAYRDLLLTYAVPPPSALLKLTVIAAATFIAGGLFFRHLKRGFADVL